MRLPMTGGCQCGHLRYEIRAEPLTVYACHCTECQRQSGAAFSLSLVAPRDAVAIVAGEPRRWRRVHPSGRIIGCIFCGECGVRLYHEPEANPKVTIVKPGTLDDTSWLAPVGHIWTRSAQRWVAMPADAVNEEAQPVNLERMIAAWRERAAG
jgi:hypothetical protein